VKTSLRESGNLSGEAIGVGDDNRFNEDDGDSSSRRYLSLHYNIWVSHGNATNFFLFCKGAIISALCKTMSVSVLISSLFGVQRARI